MEKVNEFVHRSFLDGSFHKTVWKHEDCAKKVVTYTDPKTGVGYKYFQSEENGIPALTNEAELMKDGWEVVGKEQYSPSGTQWDENKAVDNPTEVE